MATPLDIAQIVSLISAAYPNFLANRSREEIDKISEVYFQILNDLPSDLLKAATLACVSESGRKFAPSVGEIRGAVMEIRKRIAGAPASYQAWEEVRRAFIDVGHNGTPHWSHPLIKQTVDALGWVNLCMSENQVADRANFMKAFDQLEARAEDDALMLPEVKKYIEQNGGRLPAAIEETKRLAAKLEAK